MLSQIYSISPLGDTALIIDFGNIIEKGLNRKVHALARAIKEENIAYINDIVPAYSSVTICYDAIIILKVSPTRSAYSIVKTRLENLLSQDYEDLSIPAIKLRIPVCYAKRFGWDLEEITCHTNLTVNEIINIHSSKTYRVFMVGFLPGFAYMGEVDERIAVPRKAEPRSKIDEGYVGIAGKQTGIYPLTSPGGWQIIGRTPVKLFDRLKEEPVLFSAGDEVNFYSITEDEFNNY